MARKTDRVLDFQPELSKYRVIAACCRYRTFFRGSVLQREEREAAPPFAYCGSYRRERDRGQEVLKDKEHKGGAAKLNAE